MEIVSRTRSVDALSGLLILWMIIYHAFQRVGMEHTIAFAVLLKVFFFFMPWFYFKSGLFFKPVGVVNRFASDARKLLKPVIVWGGSWVYR